MKKVSSLLSLAVLCGGFALAAADPNSPDFRQTYDLAPEKVRANAARFAAESAKLPTQWKNAPATYFVVPPFSDLPRLPDGYPDDGELAGTARLLATPGEFEAASIVVYPNKNVNKFTLLPGELKNAAGGVIPASAIDVKLVKCWYQAGSGWFGYFADALGRKLVPELLLNDENLIHAIPATKDNYVRYSNQDSSVSWQWMSANFFTVNYSFDNQANTGLITDAPTFQGAVLNKDEFKQFFVTVRVPAGTKAGIYKGKVDLSADGKIFGAMPLELRVLPFTLPAPKANYDQSKGFYLCLYGTGTRIPSILKNVANHNGVTPMGFPKIDVFQPEKFKADVELAKKCGISTDILLACSEGVGLCTSSDPKGDELQKVKNLKRIIEKTGKLCREVLGHTNFYSYGVDEGGPNTIRRERTAWRMAHDAGGKVMVTSYPHRELIFALDYLIIPGAPCDRRIREVSKFHESNPDSLCGWYANPHSGPENPNYFRRLHGYQSWKSNYDVSSNYCWYRNNWNDMATPYEEGLRGLIMVYATRDNVIDTIAWEGIREGMDDVKYASYLKGLALEAAKSENGTVKLLGRRILSRLAYTDEERVDLDAFRLECINDIIRLQNAMNKGN